MTTTTDKVYYFFDEAGDPKILGRRGVNLIERGDASKTFIVGYLETSHPKEVRAALTALHERLKNDEYLAGIPSMHSTNKAFHANKDCVEVRSEVFRLLKTLDVRFYCIVAHKREEVFRERFGLKDSELYKYLVAKLLEDHLHTYPEIDCYFSVMGNVVRQDTMQEAINSALLLFGLNTTTKTTPLSASSSNRIVKSPCFKPPTIYYGLCNDLTKEERTVSSIS